MCIRRAQSGGLATIVREVVYTVTFVRLLSYCNGGEFVADINIYFIAKRLC